MQNIINILKQVQLFDNLSDTQLELIAAICETSTFNEGEILLKENEPTTDLYVISRGSVEILMDPSLVSPSTKNTVQEPVTLTDLRTGQIFGEIALVDQGVRSATVRIQVDKTQLLRISRDRLMMLCDTYPELGYRLMKNVAADLALKIRNTDLSIRQYHLLLTRKS